MGADRIPFMMWMRERNEFPIRSQLANVGRVEIRMMTKRRIQAVLYGMVLTGVSLITGAEEISIPAGRDNSIFSENGNLSLGADERIFAGKAGNGGDRRALLYFDVSSLPANAVIESVTLKLSAVIVAMPQMLSFSLHRATLAWGESQSFADQGAGGGGAGGTAKPVDATWTQNFFGSSSWNSPGGDFAPQASGEILIGPVNSYSLSTPGLLDDVRAWVSNPQENFGWILVGPATSRSAKGFASREANPENLRPSLLVVWSPPSTNSPKPTLSIQLNPAPSAPTVTVSSDSLVGFEYQFRVSDLVSPWTNLGSPVVGTGSVITREFPASGETRFFDLSASPVGSNAGGGE